MKNQLFLAILGISVLGLFGCEGMPVDQGGTNDDPAAVEQSTASLETTMFTGKNTGVSAKATAIGGAAFRSNGGFYGLFVPDSAVPQAQYGVFSFGLQYGIYGYSSDLGTGVYGFNYSTGNTGPGVSGYSAGSGDGVQGTSHDGVGVYGTSTTGKYGFLTRNSSFIGKDLEVEANEWGEEAIVTCPSSGRCQCPQGLFMTGTMDRSGSQIICNKL